MLRSVVGVVLDVGRLHLSCSPSAVCGQETDHKEQDDKNDDADDNAHCSHPTRAMQRHPMWGGGVTENRSSSALSCFRKQRGARGKREAVPELNRPESLSSSLACREEFAAPHDDADKVTASRPLFSSLLLREL